MLYFRLGNAEDDISGRGEVCGRVVFTAIELIIYFLISFIMKLLVTALHNKVTPKINFLLHYLVIYCHGNSCHVVLYFTEY